MNKDIFSTWLREFCTLVFIQSIQAFVFAIIMVLIIYVMTSGSVVEAQQNDYMSSTGFMAIIALASISKMEELVKKIFGVKPSVTDPGMRGGMKSLATTLMAANLAKGVLDNAGKVAGGVGGAFMANKKMNIARTGLAKKLAAADPNQKGSTGKSTDSGSGDSVSGQYLDKANKAKDTGNMDEYKKNLDLAEAALKAEKASSANSGGNKKSDLAKAYEDYENKMLELKEQRRKSVFKALSGGAETIGAVFGGVTGATIGASMGEGSDIIKGGLTGRGIRDKLGALPIKTVEKGTDIASGVDGILKARKDFVKSVENMNSDVKGALNKDKKIRMSYSKARAELDKRMQDFDISDM